MGYASRVVDEVEVSEVGEVKTCERRGGRRGEASSRSVAAREK